MGLCLVWGVEFPNVTLPDNLAEAAFALAERANPESGMARPAHGAPGAYKAGQDVPMADTKEDFEDPDDVHIALPFDDEELEMSELVGEAWRRTTNPSMPPSARS